MKNLLSPDEIDALTIVPLAPPHGPHTIREAIQTSLGFRATPVQVAKMIEQGVYKVLGDRFTEAFSKVHCPETERALVKLFDDVLRE